MDRVCIPQMRSEVGGPRSFQRRLAAEWHKRGIEVTYDLASAPYDAILVLGGSKKIIELFSRKRGGVPIVQRLGGINWLHKILKPGLRSQALADMRNSMQVAVRRYLADHVVYQSGFVKEWWERTHGATRPPSSVIWNGVDLEVFSAVGPSMDRDSILCVEGNIRSGYESGLSWLLAACLQVRQEHGRDVHLTIVGNLEPGLARTMSQYAWVECIGEVPEEKVRDFHRAASCFASLDVNAACPNSVVEAMASGLPIVGFATGALPELVGPASGAIVPFGGDPWSLESPDISGLADGIVRVLDERERLSKGAREFAEAHLSISTMANRYLEVLHTVSRDR